MGGDFFIISELGDIRKKQADLIKREKQLKEPKLTDLNLIPIIYEWFKEILSEMEFSPNPESPQQRKVFLFIILFLYNPGALAGDNRMG